ncbi:MAG: ubiquinone/menaquinone biosynthesis methyltransferase [Verrucomicrobia bacterium]|nr:ubiquinone/menaquinone biosynthesis methyltransferase [Verrucomicrobiota bacterium]
MEIYKENPEMVRGLFSDIAGRYQVVNHLLSGGLDFYWRAIAVRLIRPWNPATVLDIATGTGDLAMAIRKNCPDARVVGADFCAPMLDVARKNGLPELVVADGMNLPFADQNFEVVTAAFGLRNMASWEKGLSEMARVLKPGGHLLILDFSLPTLPVIRPLYRAYLHHVLPIMAGIVTGRKDAYEYLGVSIEQFPSGKAMTSLIDSCGFRDAMAHPLTLGTVSIYTAIRE